VEESVITLKMVT